MGTDPSAEGGSVFVFARAWKTKLHSLRVFLIPGACLSHSIWIRKCLIDKLIFLHQRSSSQVMRFSVI